jgi:transcription elongation factor Elf1
MISPEYEADVVCPACGHSMHFPDAEALIGREVVCGRCGQSLEMDNGEVPGGELGYFLLDRSDVRED